MPDLKHCPFCGANANFCSQHGRHGLFAWIECDECGARTKSVSTEYSVNDEEFSISIQAARLLAWWNRRDKK